MAPFNIDGYAVLLAPVGANLLFSPQRKGEITPVLQHPHGEAQFWSEGRAGLWV